MFVTGVSEMENLTSSKRRMYIILPVTKWVGYKTAQMCKIFFFLWYCQCGVLMFSTSEESRKCWHAISVSGFFLKTCITTFTTFRRNSLYAFGEELKWWTGL